jgi:predicted nucleotidyltransferase
MEQQEKIIKCLTAFFRKDTQRIQGAVLFGSFGRGKCSPESDIDIELLVINDKIDIDEFTNDVIQLFHDTEESLVVKHTIWLAAQRKLALYHGSKLLLTELYLYCKYETLKNLMFLSILAELSQFDKYFLGSRIIDLSKCILLDRDGIIHQHITYILTIPYDDPHGLVFDLVGSNQFHYLFDSLIY